MSWLWAVLGLLVSYAASGPSRLLDPLHAVLVAAAYLFGLSLGFFAGGSGLVALASGVLSGALLGRRNRHLILGGIGLNAAERLAFKLAWRRGGFLLPDDLEKAGLDPDTARNLLEDLSQRGLCRKDGDGYRFER
ncbi:hypothetical protein [Oceanithermus sp.]